MCRKVLNCNNWRLLMTRVAYSIAVYRAEYSTSCIEQQLADMLHTAFKLSFMVTFVHQVAKSLVVLRDFQISLMPDFLQYFKPVTDRKMRYKLC